MKVRAIVDRPLAYAPDVAYFVGDTIEHTKFGVGVVIETFETAIEVLFANHVSRRLIHRRVKGEKKP